MAILWLLRRLWRRRSCLVFFFFFSFDFGHKICKQKKKTTKFRLNNEKLYPKNNKTWADIRILFTFKTILKIINERKSKTKHKIQQIFGHLNSLNCISSVFCGFWSHIRSHRLTIFDTFVILISKQIHLFYLLSFESSHNESIKINISRVSKGIYLWLILH